MDVGQQQHQNAISQLMAAMSINVEIESMLPDEALDNKQIDCALQIQNKITKQEEVGQTEENRISKLLLPYYRYET